MLQIKKTKEFYQSVILFDKFYHLIEIYKIYNAKLNIKNKNSLNYLI